MTHCLFSTIPFGTGIRYKGNETRLRNDKGQVFKSQRRALIHLRETIRHPDLERTTWEALEAAFQRALKNNEADFAGMKWIRVPRGER